MGSIATTQDRCSRYEYQGMKMLSKYFLRDLVDCGTLCKTFGPRFRYQVCFSGCCQNFTILGFDLLFIFYVLTDNVAFLVICSQCEVVSCVQCTVYQCTGCVPVFTGVRCAQTSSVFTLQFDLFYMWKKL